MVLRAFLLLLAVVVTMSYADGRGLRTDLREHPDQAQARGFELMDWAGDKRQLGQFRGKVLVVNFWATWCGPCRQEFPALQAVWAALPRDSFEILAINVGEDASIIRHFLAQMKPAVEFQVLLDDNMSVTRRWGVRVLPTTFVLDRAGRIRYSAEGGRDFRQPEILDRLKALTAG